MIITNNNIELLESSFPKYFKDESIIEKIKNNPYTNYYLVTKTGICLAFINYDLIYERAELSQIEVLKEYQRQGIASKLLEFFIEDCKNKQIKNITLEVKIDNVKAINLYKKYGFKQVAIRKKYYNGIDGILMEKVL